VESNIQVNTEIVDINSLKPYPKNPRRGDVEAIAKSLEHNGQYKPIVVNRKDNSILAGNHTWRAARSLGWNEIAVSWVDVDDVGAGKIVLADNRTSDMSIYDDSKLLDLLNSLSNLEGTGFSDVDIDQLSSLFEGGDLFDAPNTERTGEVSSSVRVYVGSYRIMVDADPYMEWADDLLQKYEDDKNIEQELKNRLHLGDATALPPKKRAGRPAKKAVQKSTMKSAMVETVNVDINSVFPYPMNARQGDIGLIAESLAENGQFRPIVVNKRDNSILVGNHTWKAAKSLGWKEIAVTFVDVDDEEAAKIVLVDNRTADLGSYDHVELVDLLREMPSHEGTGYTPEDLDDLLHDIAGWGDSREVKPQDDVDKERNITANVGRWEFKFERKFFDEWEEFMFDNYGYAYEEVCAGIVELLRIPNDAWVETKQRKSKRKSARSSNQ
jgi:ParB-like chromosome segregation protein Spo0J